MTQLGGQIQTDLHYSDASANCVLITLQNKKEVKEEEERKK
jgi:hypothetical protein